MAADNRSTALNNSPTRLKGDAVERRVLVVDDNLKVLDVVGKMLDMLGYRAELAYGGEEAIRKISRNRYDVVLTDLDMPDMDGVNLGFRIKKASPAIKMIIMTGRCEAEVEEFIHSSVVDNWIFKPFRLYELDSMLNGLS